MNTVVIRAFLCAACTVLAACGGGGSEGGGTPAPIAPSPVPPPAGPVPLPDLPAAGTAFAVISDAGDPVGGGRGAFSYTLANAGIRVTRTGALLQVEVLGDEVWLGRFVSPNGGAPLSIGEFLNLSDGSGGTGSTASQTWGPEPLLRNCQQPLGSLRITEVSYSGAKLERLALDFNQQCAGTAGGLRGRLRWDAADSTQPPGPTVIPGHLWRAPAGSVPLSGNYVHLEGGTGEEMGSGPTWQFTPENALIGLSAGGRKLKFIIQGDQRWFGGFHAMSSRRRIEVGHYPLVLDPQRYNPAKGALGWFKGTADCSRTSRAWVAVDSVSYSGDRLQSLEMRFEQQCGDGANKPPLRGQIRWSADDDRRPLGPQPVPMALWQPSPSALPSSGSYIHLVSEPGEYVGGGVTRTLLAADQSLVLYETDGRIEVRAGGNASWSGTFRGPAGWGRPQAGYYGQLLSVAFGNPARGGVAWSGEGRGCDQQGWFVIDSVSYSHGVLRSLEMRFQQSCTASGPRLLGKISWQSPDPVVTLGPIDPVTLPSPPAPPLQVPSNESYLLLDSGDDDYVGQGGTYLYTKANADLGLSYRYGGLEVSIRGEERWLGRFLPPAGQALGSEASFNWAALTSGDSGLGPQLWSGEGRGCDVVDGSWSVQGLRVVGERVLAVDLSFEQTCDVSQLPLRGRLVWRDGDTTSPAGPALTPVELWRLPAELVPHAGNYLFLHSPAGAFIGQGSNRLFTGADTSFDLKVAADSQLTLTLIDAMQQRWDLELAPMTGLTRFVPGYYGDLKKLVELNPARGGIDFFGASRGCNELRGWFAIDAIGYDGSNITHLAMRFGLFCEERSPPIYGQLRWSR